MASSQVDIASSAPIGCVLRYQNRHDRCRESNAHATFQKNLTNLVRGHLHSCISISSGCSASGKNSRNQNNDVDSWVSNGDTNNHQSLRFMRNNHKNNDTLRRSRILDRWAAQKAREMVSTIEKHSHEAELLSLSNSHSVVSSRASSSRREDSPVPSDSSAGTFNPGASSLVQIWEKRLNNFDSTKSNSSASPTGSISGYSCNYNGSSVEEPSTGEAGNPVEERYDARRNEDLFADLESDRRALSDPPPSTQGQNSDSGESERVRVADIIKRLIAANQKRFPLSSSWSDDNDYGQSSVHGSPSGEHEHLLLSDQVEHKVLQQVISSPRIRGRQAFKDLLMQLERDRHRELGTLVERRAVSRFAQRGRIQSLIRLRLLQRDAAIQDQRCRPSTPSEVSRLPQGSTVMRLRDRFRTGVEQVATAKNVAAYPRSPHSEIVNNTTHLDNCSTPNQPSDGTHNQEVSITEQHSTVQVQNSMSDTREDVHEEASPSSDATWQVTGSEARNLDSEKTAETTTSFNFWSENEIEEELEVSDHEYAETSYDWIGDISRPRSYWEGCRQARYQDVLNNSDNGDIRQLLQRRTVSNFLGSDFREKMDRLMVSRLARQTHAEEEEEDGSQERMDQLMSFLQRHTHQSDSQEEEEGQEEEEDRDETEEEEEEEESLISRQYRGGGDYFDQSSSLLQLPLPSPSWSWNYRDNEVDDHSDRITSTSPPQHLPSQPYSQDSRQNPSSTDRNSTEMELIYDLRGHMEQLYQEMSELRKSIKSCMDMQMILQQSMKQEVHLVRGEGKQSYDEAPKKGNCCICYEMQVDSLLYRCGHMCTCLKCAHELQWSNAKCPICRAPIMDVVRAYVGS